MNYDRVDVDGPVVFGASKIKNVTQPVSDNGSVTSRDPVSFTLECEGTCGSTNTNADQQVPVALIHDANRAFDKDDTISLKTLAKVIGKNDTYDVYQSKTAPLPRGNLSFSIEITEADGTYYNDTYLDIPIGFVNNSHAQFPPPITTHESSSPVRGQDVLLLQSHKTYQDGHFGTFSQDPDAYDVRATADPQNLTWRWGDGQERYDVLLTEEQIGSFPSLRARMDHLSRDGCFEATVTVNDSVGIWNEINDTRNDLGGHYDPPSFNNDSAETFWLHDICVQNSLPVLDQISVFDDPERPTENHTFLFHGYHDADHPTYDDLRFTIYDRALDPATTDFTTIPATQIITTLNATTLTANGLTLSFAKTSFPTSSATVCVMDIERNALLAGIPTTDVDNLVKPVCRILQDLTTNTLPDIRGITRLFLDFTNTAPSTQWNGTVQDVHIPLTNTAPDLEAELRRILTLQESDTRLPIHQLIIENTQIPTNPTIIDLITKLHMKGVLVIVPSGIPQDTNVTPYWESKGIHAHPYAFTIATSHQNKTWIRQDSAFGPNKILHDKPDISIKVPDTHNANDAQLHAVRHASDYALYYQLKGIHDPWLIQQLIQRQARPLLDGTQSLGLRAETGHGVLDPADFGRTNTTLHLDTISQEDLQWSVADQDPAVVSPLPIIPTNTFDVGVVNHELITTGTLFLLNPNTLLHNTTDTYDGNMETLFPDTYDPYSDTTLIEPTATINITYYNVNEMFFEDFTNTTRHFQTFYQTSDLMNRTVEDTYHDPFSFTPEDAEAFRDQADKLGDHLTPHYFFPEVTTTVGHAQIGTDCVKPSDASAGTLLYQAWLKISVRHAAVPSDTKTQLEQIQDNLMSQKDGLAIAVQDLEGCGALEGLILDHMDHAIENITEAILLLGGDALLEDLEDRLTKLRDDYHRLMTKSVRRATSFGLDWVNLTTDPAKTKAAPLGPYLGYVRITTHDLCDQEPTTGEDRVCQDVTQTYSTSLYLAGTLDFHLQDRAERPIISRDVSLQPSGPGEVNCDGERVPIDRYGLWNSFTQRGYSADRSPMEATNADGVAKFYRLLPGYYSPIFPGSFPIEIAEETNSWPAERIVFNEQGSCRYFKAFYDEHVRMPALTDLLVALAGCVKTDADGLSYTRPRLLSGACTDETTVTEEDLADGRAILSDLRRYMDALTTNKTQNVTFTFPQVQQARMIDNISGADMEAFNLEDAGVLDEWRFTTEDDAVVADGGLVNNNIGAFTYNVSVPPNEFIKAFWTFDVDRINSEAIAIFSLRDDVDFAVRTFMDGYQPGDAGDTAEQLGDFLADELAPDYYEIENTSYSYYQLDTTHCAGHNKYRIFPLMGGDPTELKINPTIDDDGTKYFYNTTALVSGAGRHDQFSVAMSFETRKCPPLKAYITFVFWEMVDGQLDVGARFGIDAHRLMLITGLGTSSPLIGRDESGTWLGVDRYEPKAEEWDLWVDVPDHTTGYSMSFPMGGPVSPVSITPEVRNPESMRGVLDSPWQPIVPRPDRNMTYPFIVDMRANTTSDHLWRKALETESGLPIGINETLEMLWNGTDLAARGLKTILDEAKKEYVEIETERPVYEVYDPDADDNETEGGQDVTRPSAWTRNNHCYYNTTLLLRRVMTDSWPDERTGSNSLNILFGGAWQERPNPRHGGIRWIMDRPCDYFPPSEMYFNELRVTKEMAATYPVFWNLTGVHRGNNTYRAHWNGTYDPTDGSFLMDTGQRIRNGALLDSAYVGFDLRTVEGDSIQQQALEGGSYNNTTGIYSWWGRQWTGGRYLDNIYYGTLTNTTPGGGTFSGTRTNVVWNATGSCYEDAGGCWTGGTLRDAFYFGETCYEGAFNATQVATWSACYPFAADLWEPAENTFDHFIRFDANMTYREFVRDPLRFGLETGYSFRMGDQTYTVRFKDAELWFGLADGLFPGEREVAGETTSYRVLRDAVVGITRLDGPLREVEDVGAVDYWWDRSEKWFSVGWNPDSPTQAHFDRCDAERNVCEPVVPRCDDVPPSGTCLNVGPRDDRWLVFNGTTEVLVSSGLVIERPAEVWIWNPFIEEYVVLKPSGGPVVVPDP